MVNSETIAPGSASMATIWTTFACSSPSADIDSLSKNRLKKWRMRVLNLGSLITQRHQRIEARGATRRQITRHERRDGEHRKYAGIRSPIGGSHAREESPEGQAHTQAQTESD